MLLRDVDAFVRIESYSGEVVAQAEICPIGGKKLEVIFSERVDACKYQGAPGDHQVGGWRQIGAIAAEPIVDLFDDLSISGAKVDSVNRGSAQLVDKPLREAEI